MDSLISEGFVKTKKRMYPTTVYVFLDQNDFHSALKPFGKWIYYNPDGSIKEVRNYKRRKFTS